MQHHPAPGSVFSPGSEPRHRLDAVDALRGLAIFFVLMNHVNMRLFLDKFPYWQAIPDRLRGALVWNGQNGVQIFFYLFVAGGRPGAAVTPLFVAVIVFSGILGELVARYFSDPLNRMLRHHWE
jgi:peptidoglycan/LPS O-acetylase OafA/YrhL